MKTSVQHLQWHFSQDFNFVSVLNHFLFEEEGHISKMTGYSSHLLVIITLVFAALKIYFAPGILFIMGCTTT